MKIAYFDLNEDDFCEDYSDNPNQYGGGRIVAAGLLDSVGYIDIFGDLKCFTNVKESKKHQCFALPSEIKNKIKAGEEIKNLIPNAESYDIFFHHFANRSINLNGLPNSKQVVWPVGWKESVSSKIKNVLLFDFNSETRYSPDTKIYKIVIGPKFSPFQEYKKEDFIFQCSRHCQHYSSIQVAEFCNKNNIKAYFAGPIDEGYKLLEEIDNKNTFYLGVISQDLKRELFKKSKANVQIQNYPISVTLTAKEAASYGNMIIKYPNGNDDWVSFIEESKNGFFVKNGKEFLDAWSKRNTIKQLDCYSLGKQHSEENMNRLVIEALNKIKSE